MIEIEVPFAAGSLEGSLYDEPVCFICGAETSTAYFVHVTTDDTLTDVAEHPKSRGLFPVGWKCSTRIPSTFRFKSSERRKVDRSVPRG